MSRASRCAPPAAASLAAGDTQVLFTVPTALTPLIQAGKVRALAVSGLKRYSLMPDVPTVAESGLARFEAIAWNGVLVFWLALTAYGVFLVVMSVATARANRVMDLEEIVVPEHHPAMA